MGVAGWIWMIVVWAAVIGLVVWAVARIFPAAGQKQRPGEIALDVLDRRYARGEIDDETYERMRAELNRSGAQRR